MARRAVYCVLPAAFCLLRLAATPDLMAQITSGPPSNLRLSGATSTTSAGSPEDRVVDDVSAARQAIRAQPDSAASHLSLGVALKAAGEQESALKAFQKALDCDPRLAEAWFEKGLLEADRQKWSRAAGDFRRAVEVSANHIDARLELGEMLRSEWTVFLRDAGHV